MNHDERNEFHERATSSMNATPLIRAYDDSDAAAVRALFILINREMAPAALRAAFEAYIDLSLREEIDRIPAYYGDRGGSFWIAEQDGVLIGTYGLERIGARTAELRRMYVAPEARRRGIARALLAHAEQQCRAAGFDRLQLATAELQQAALAFYRVAGFRVVREEIAAAATNKTVGSGLRRFHMEKQLTDLPPTRLCPSPQ
jgi:putative acetyltransferase